MHTELVDTHAHLDMEPYQEDLDLVVQRAREAGLKHIICVGTGPASTRAGLDVARRYPDMVRATAGIHPSFWNGAGPSEMDAVERLAREPQVVAVGETGLDFHYDYTPRADQIAAFERHVELALQVDLPLIIHCRKADEQVLEILRRSADGTAGERLRGVRHCFDRPWSRAVPFLELGFHIAVGGAVTRPGYKKFKQAVGRIPDDRLLLETDCPYQTPTPHKGNRNEPAFLLDTATAVADIRGETVDELARRTTENARMLFRI